jgi:hypothetical protein
MDGTLVMNFPQRAAIVVALLFAACSCGGNLGRVIPAQNDAGNREQLPQDAADENASARDVPESSTKTQRMHALIATKQNKPAGWSMSGWAANVELWQYPNMKVAEPHAAGIKTFGYLTTKTAAARTPERNPIVPGCRRRRSISKRAPERLFRRATARPHTRRFNTLETRHRRLFRRTAPIF